MKGCPDCQWPSLHCCQVRGGREGVPGLPKAVTALLSGARGVEGVPGLPKAVTALLSGVREG